MEIKSAQTRRLYKFGLFEADSEQGTLSRQVYPEAAAATLPDFSSAAGGTRKSAVEFDGRLNTALMKLRAPLNDKFENPIFIETLPRSGYRFIAPIEVALASYEMWPEPRALAAATNAYGASTSVGKGYRWNAHLLRRARQTSRH